ncbi:leucine-rich repeat-containing protein 42-like [Mytilus trossulus]|uniref:leucine-rich repeat-containing protein 42-like n=1 Tax=Mytilus trossulus TaxID=6551 RepID=UPI003006FBCC
MNGKRLKTHDISEERQRTPESLLSQCIHYVADNLCEVDSFYGLPDLIAEQIFRKAESLDKFDLDDKNSFHALSVFTTVYEDLIISSLNLSNQYLGVNFCQDRLNLLTSLREIDLTGCKLGDEHDFLNDLGQLQRLEILCLSDNSLSDKGIQRLTCPYRVCGQGPAGLTKLDVSDNWEVTGKVFKYLNPFSKLTEIDVTSTQVKGNPELLKTWKFKPVKDDGTLKKIFNEGWASDVVQKWMKTAVYKATCVKVKKELTKTQHFYSKKRKRSTEDKLIVTESKDIRTVSGYRLHLTRQEISSVEVPDDSKQTDCSDVHKHSKNKLKQQKQLNNNSDDIDHSDTDLLSMYGNPAHATKNDQKMTLESALKSRAW